MYFYKKRINIRVINNFKQAVINYVLIKCILTSQSKKKKN